MTPACCKVAQDHRGRDAGCARRFPLSEKGFEGRTGMWDEVGVTAAITIDTRIVLAVPASQAGVMNLVACVNDKLNTRRTPTQPFQL